MRRMMWLLSMAALTIVGCSSADEDKSQPASGPAVSETKTDGDTTNTGGNAGESVESDPKAADSGQPASDESTAQPATAVATFGNGCYWCTEAVFQEFDGVQSVVAGFSGGEDPNVTYTDVVTGRTGHAEVVQITYDPGRVSFHDLLQAFFLTHDPTTLNRQGPDIGTQYRSVVFYHDAGQKELVETAIKELTAQGVWDDPIVTEVAPFEHFIKADNYHQDYFDKNPNDLYCLQQIPAKLQKIRKVFKDKLKK